MKLQVGVKILIQSPEGEYLFLKRHKFLEHGGHATWDIPGGRIESHEPLMEALRREVKEETGLEVVGAPRLLAAQDIIIEEKGLHVVRLTYAGKAEGEICLSDEHTAYEYMSVDEAKASGDKLDPYLAEVL